MIVKQFGESWFVSIVEDHRCVSDDVGVDRRLCVGVVVGWYASVVVRGLQREEPIFPVERNGGWCRWPGGDSANRALLGEGQLLGCVAA